jgi:hypothetical protein
MHIFCRSVPAQKLRREVGPRVERVIICLKFYDQNQCSKNDVFTSQNAILRLCFVIKDAAEQATIVPMLVLPQ